MKPFGKTVRIRLGQPLTLTPLNCCGGGGELELTSMKLEEVGDIG